MANENKVKLTAVDVQYVIGCHVAMFDFINKAHRMSHSQHNSGSVAANKCFQYEGKKFS